VAFVASRTGDRSLAEDVVQAAFANALDRLDELHDEDKVVAWFYRSLRNAIVDGFRRRQAERHALASFLAEIDDRLAAIETPPARVCRCVLRVAESLKPEYLAALQTIEVDGVAVKAFAETAGISNANAAVRLFRAREALRRGVLATCGAYAAGGCTDCTCDSDAADAHGCSH
jgi:RNA polymerase sigma factor (sigma-70 family)